MSVCILGTGNYAKAIGARIIHAGIDVVYGSRRVPPRSNEPSSIPNPTLSLLNFGSSNLTDGPLIYHPSDAVKDAKIVIMAIPISGHADTAAMIRNHLNPHTVVIDVSNTSFSRSEAQKHAEMMESKISTLSDTPSPTPTIHHHTVPRARSEHRKSQRKHKKDKRKVDFSSRIPFSTSSERTSLLRPQSTTGDYYSTSYMSINGDESPITIESEDVVIEMPNPVPLQLDAPPIVNTDMIASHEDPYHKLHCIDPCCDPATESGIVPPFATASSTTTANDTKPKGSSIADIENLSNHPRVANLIKSGKPSDSPLDDCEESCVGCEDVEGGECRSDAKYRGVANPWNRKCARLSNAEHLQRLLPGVNVVKAFNTVSAYALQAGPGGVQEDRVLVCGDSQEAKDAVFGLIWAMGMRPVDVGPLISARDTERKSVTLFEDWRVACWVSAGLFLFASTYIFIRDIVFSPYGFYPTDLFLLKFNVIVAWHALALFAATFAAGIIAALRQLSTGTAKKRFANWLDSWLNSRKALGLMALASAAVHMIAATITDHLFVNFDFIRSTEGKCYQASIFSALLSTLIYGCLVATSIPSVSANLSWREWTFIQSKLGIVGLFFGTAHAGLMMFALGDLPNVKAWPHYLAPASLIITALASVVLILRAFIEFPPIAKRIAKIRGGG